MARKGMPSIGDYRSVSRLGSLFRPPGFSPRSNVRKRTYIFCTAPTKKLPMLLSYRILVFSNVRTAHLRFKRGPAAGHFLGDDENALVA